MEEKTTVDWIDEYILPSHYASALINNDRRGLSDEMELDEWLEKVKNQAIV